MDSIDGCFDSMEQFYLYAREKSCQLGGVPYRTIIAGYAPAILYNFFEAKEILKGNHSLEILRFLHRIVHRTQPHFTHFLHRTTEKIQNHLKT